MARLLCFSILLLVFSALRAQSTPFARPVSRHLGLEDGLPHRTNRSANYDRDSILWLSTESALCRYDGYQINSFPQLKERLNGSLRRNEDSLFYVVHAIYRDSLEIFDPVKKQSYGVRLSSGLSGFFSSTTHKDGEPLYFAQGGFIYQFLRNSAPKIVHALDAETQKGDLLVYADSDGYLLYLSGSNVLKEVRKGGGKTSAKLPPFANEPVIHAARNGDVWIGTSTGLYRKEAGSNKLIQGPELPTGNPVNSIFEDRSGRFIFGYRHPFLLRYQGLISYSAGKVHPLRWLQDIDDRIIDISGTDFYREMNVSTYGGFTRLTFPDNGASPFRRYLYDPDVPAGGFGHVMRGFAADNDGNIYANKDTRQPHWFRVRAGSLKADTLVMLDNSGNVIDNFGCGTNMLNYQGDIYGTSCTLGDRDTAHVYRYRPADSGWKRWPLPVLDQKIRWIMKLPGQPRFLVVTQGTRGKKGALYYFNPSSGLFLTIRPAGPTYDIEGYTKRAVFDSVRQVVWLATTGGLYKFSPDTEHLNRYQFTNGRATEISDIYLNKDGTLLLGTFKTGLQRFSLESETFFQVGGTISDEDPFTQTSDYLPLPSNDIAAFRVTPEKYLLTATFNGLSLHGYNENIGDVYTTLDGLPSNEFNTPSLFYHAEDKRWFAGGVNGFVSFQVKDLVRETSPFSPILLRTRLLDEKAGFEQSSPLQSHLNEPLVINPSVAYFSLEFTVPDYSLRRHPRYQTRLIGLDPDWRAPTSVPSVRYARVPAGEYTFQLRAIDGEGRLTATVRELQIKVLKPWFHTYWFYTICALFIAALIWAYILFRERRLKQDHQAKRQLQFLELRVLRQQMNPHFISNAMNAIRDFVYAEKPDRAAEYLTDFTRLMRLFLEASRNHYTSISNETDLLRRYIRLEQLRFPGKFNFSIHIAPEIEPDMDEFPSLLLQPIVENAINHGLCHLDSGGQLAVEFTLDPNDDDIIVCTISDNGIGRKAAAGLKNTSPDHISLATQILEDRQLLLAEEGVIRLDITSEDLYPDHQQSGTIVTIRVEPLEAKA